MGAARIEREVAKVRGVDRRTLFFHGGELSKAHEARMQYRREVAALHVRYADLIVECSPVATLVNAHTNALIDNVMLSVTPIMEVSA